MLFEAELPNIAKKSWPSKIFIILMKKQCIFKDVIFKRYEA